MPIVKFGAPSKAERVEKRGGRIEKICADCGKKYIETAKGCPYHNPKDQGDAK